ncbi:helix-turn-helix transcriptional regulator [Candidatus Pelagibacter sp.]|nr:helix-turn-helix transcriptional regulator [Candidatus Pelagibacter sp.]BAR32420.1 putative lexA-like repressor [uncultured Mediterranean phage uvMED]|tara:strand:+ start:96 stop:1610 length:1515 start_codon:yes stop_codon:yes gene_type:complete
MKLIDRYDPKLSEANQRLSAKNLISTYTTERKIPYIEMRLLGDQVIATVTFDFWYDKKRTKKFAEFDKINRTIEGPSDEVYKLAAKQASKISLSLSSIFNDEWQKTLVNLLNKPSKNKTVLNLGLYRNNNYGIYDITNPSILLDQKIKESGMSLKDVALLSGQNETTLFRHLKGTFEISRDAAIKYAKVLGCDPAKILFNDLSIPVWGSADTLEQSSIERLSVYASEITANENLGVIECPREIYRPDVKAIKIDSPNSHLHGHVGFYYNSNEPIDLEDQMVIVGTNLKNLVGGEIRQRYFIGTYKKNRNGRTVDIHSIDPTVIDISGVTPDEDFHSYEDFVGLEEGQRIVIDDITPTFVAPLVALINPSEVFSDKKIDIQKAYNEIYTQSRTDEVKALKIFKNNQMKSIIEEQLEDNIDDYVDQMNHQKIKALIMADKKLQSVISTAAYGKAKYEKKIDIKEEAKKIKADLSAKEELIVREAVDRLQEQMDLPGPDDEDYINRP